MARFNTVPPGLPLALLAFLTPGLQAFCDAGRFGKSCRYSCNCQVECDQDTGACPGNCSAGWVKGGQMCQKKNIAYKKTASSTTNTVYQSWSPENAVDGNNNIRGENDTCFHGDFKKNELTIDLGKVYKLYHMRFYIRYDYKNRMSNSLIYLDGDQSRVCYTFPPSVSNNPTDVVCDGEARRLTIENPGTGANFDTPLNICEVEIYNCSPGTYGDNCTDFCHCSGCDVRTGVCTGDCFEGWQGDRCDRASCDAVRFGESCRYFCNCQVECDQDTGACPGNCSAGWVKGGQLCQKQNIAYKKTASSTTNTVYQSWSPENAVDGNNNIRGENDTCFHGDFKRNELTIDLGKVYKLYHMRFYIRYDYKRRMSNSLIYLDGDQSRVCYTFPPSVSNNPTDVVCDGEARRLTIENPGAGANSDIPLNICEVEIYHCSPGTYGENCTDFCHCSGCDVRTGVCNGDCFEGWHGDRCDRECSPGTYGKDCNYFCHCSDCDVRTGVCTGDCFDRWQGDRCDIECSPGTYGKNCTNLCHCSDCDVRTGVCTGDCFEGWQGDRCDLECSPGTYGKNCTNVCHCGDCDARTGVCSGDCFKGWQGEKCDKECSPGTYGKDCTNLCHCGDCDVRTGVCTGDCLEGWQGDRCDLECSHGTYGKNCTNLCHCSDCDVRTGVCTGDCFEGWQGDRCDIECSPGTYGKKCTNVCHCGDCDARTGVCSGDCFKGWQGDKCDKECSPGTYGKKCTNLCHCGDCDARTGVCTGDCFEGWQGDRCVIECSPGTYGKNCTNLCHCSDCDVRTGACTGDCFEGWQGDRCDIECSPGTYGKNCTNVCHCGDCDARTGVCSGDCFKGWQGDKCDKECSPGTYGKQCTNLCHCGDCDARTGVCTGDCFEGWQGDRCDLGVSDAAESTTTDIRTTALSTTVGVLLVIIVILTVVIIRRKRRQHSSGKTSEGDNITVPGSNPTQDPIYTEMTSTDTNRSSTLANYERFQFTEDNQYTGLQGRNPYENI